METIRIVTDVSKHVECGGLMAMSQDAPQYIVEHEGLEARIPGSRWYVSAAEREFARRTKWKHQANRLLKPAMHGRLQ
jgi:hypothetical protein